MSDLAMPLAEVSVAAPLGMITVRTSHDGDLSDRLASLGLGLPDRRQITAYSNGQVAWMSPDELLVLVSRGTLAGMITGLSQTLADRHHLVTDVSDARAMFRINGPDANQVLAKLSPVDLLDGAFPMGELRRTRLAQVPAAFWRDDAGFTLICFRSVAQYAQDLLTNAAKPGTGL